MRLPNVTIFAYDTDKEARNSLENLRDINKLYNIVINSECSHECLSNKSDSNTLIFCDIEGFEKNVSYLSRKDCGISSHKDDKIFSKNSYFWDYKKILNNLNCKYTFYDCLLHTSSLGPFYKVFEIEK